MSSGVKILLPTELFRAVVNLIETTGFDREYVYITPGGNRIICNRVHHPESGEDYIDIESAIGEIEIN